VRDHVKERRRNLRLAESGNEKKMKMVCLGLDGGIDQVDLNLAVYPPEQGMRAH
jgi:hypothetical protein